ncbi:hypothetical protein CIB48_g6611 [Xylaria polymorpha]|nr:hypothetical protein CIB48_g6611 [Xylaria polymorpha]
MVHATRKNEAAEEVDTPFLLTSEYLDDESHVPARRTPSFNTFLFSACFNLICISVYTILLLIALARYGGNKTTAIHRLEFKYVAQKYLYVEASPFSGPPSSSVDEAWHELLKYTALRASAPELESSNQTSVELPEGGYMKMLRQWKYHHCLDLLRSATMCHADTTLTTFRWADAPEPMLDTRRVDHKCIDWERLMDSIEHRVVDSDEMSRMVNPAMK